MANQQQLFALLREQGFEIEQTGGGCTGWIKVIGGDSAHHVLVTQHDYPHHGVEENDWCVGVYDEEHEEGAAIYFPRSLPDSEVFFWDQTRLFRRDTLAEALRSALKLDATPTLPKVEEVKDDHTPGPWYLKSWHEPLVVTREGDHIASVFADKNRHLISAAPQLLDALRGLIPLIEEHASEIADEVLVEARAAIRRATNG